MSEYECLYEVCVCVRERERWEERDTEVLIQRFSNFSTHQKHLQSLLEQISACPYPKFPNWGGPENLHLNKFVGNADIVGPKPYFEHYLSIGLMFNKTLR